MSCYVSVTFPNLSLLGAVCGSRNRTLRNIEDITGCEVVRRDDLSAILVWGEQARDAVRMLEAHCIHIINPKIASFKPTRFAAVTSHEAGRIIGREWQRVKDCEAIHGCEVRVAAAPADPAGLATIAVTAETVPCVEAAMEFLLSGQRLCGQHRNETSPTAEIVPCPCPCP
jgi:hypothetical protein